MSDNNSGFTPPQAPPVGFSDIAKLDQSESNKTILPIVLFLILLPTVHRFYVGKIGTGLLFFFTIGGLGIWWIYDVIISITGNFTDKQGRKITRWI
jgi:TM2 domain-containing membrane protein YozV